MTTEQAQYLDRWIAGWCTVLVEEGILTPAGGEANE